MTVKEITLLNGG